MQSLSNRWKIALAMLVAILMVTMSYYLINQHIATRTKALVEQDQHKMLWVLVYAADFEQGHVLTLQDVVQRRFPPQYISDDWLVPRDAGTVVGSRIQEYVSAGEPVTLAKLRKQKHEGLSHKIPAGYFAVTSMVSMEQLHHGMVSAGDRVAIISQSSNIAQAPLTNIEVLAVDRQQQSSQEISRQVSIRNAIGTTITFKLSAEQARQFETMRRAGFQVWLQRPNTDYQVEAPREAVEIHPF